MTAAGLVGLVRRGWWWFCDYVYVTSHQLRAIAARTSPDDLLAGEDPRPSSHALPPAVRDLVGGAVQGVELEAAGLTAEVLQGGSGQAVTIPMLEDRRSLNLSTSVGIATYEALRQVQLGEAARQPPPAS